MKYTMTMKLVRSVFNETMTVLISDCSLATSLHQTASSTLPLATLNYLLTNLLTHLRRDGVHLDA